MIEIERNTESDDFVFENKTVGGTIPKEYIRGVEAGVKDALTAGVIAGYPVIGVKARVVDGSYHDVDSSDLAFRMAASMATREAVARTPIPSSSSRSWISRSSCRKSTWGTSWRTSRRDGGR